MSRSHGLRPLLFAAAVLVTAVSLVALPGRPARADEKLPPPMDRIKMLLQERLATAKDIHELVLKRYTQGATTIDQVHRAKIGLMQARLALTETKEDRLKVYEEIVKDAKDWELTAVRNLQEGRGSQIDTLLARAYRIEVEIAFEQTRVAK